MRTMTGQPAAAGSEDQRGAAAPRPGAAPGRPLLPAQPGRPDVFTFGETMVALRGSGPLKLGGTMNVSIAGAESNVAIGLARLGHDVRWAGAVGEDEAGQLVLRTLRAEGVGVSGASTDPGAPTGLLLFEPRLPEVTRVHYYRAGSAGSRIGSDVIERAFSAAPPRVLHLTGITPSLSTTARAAARSTLQLARESGTLVCVDVNFRARLWTAEAAAEVLREWIPFVDVLIASDDELPLCLPGGGGGEGSSGGGEGSHGAKGPTGANGGLRAEGVGAGMGAEGDDGGLARWASEQEEATAAGAGVCGDAVPLPPQEAAGDPAVTVAAQARLLLDQGVGEVVVKLGAEGATAFTHGGSLHRPAKPVRAVDAVGAGDAFVAGYLSALLDGEGPAGRLERAVTTGAFAVASPGDWEGAPTRAELGMLGAPPGSVVR
ncbi:sugar kinase [Streptomyces sp. Je 1-4]|uniref:sugar kinase n=1 Tax=Streptomyces TaxID=1883 RepID=UPI0021DAE1A7|nr:MULTISPECIES: sugar kinase [unclassified Streptomyces]UYB42653.1 sugar kinase [Streptomyces sp. Je 1-4]UZQ38972.1 sugar kinase [Streptomyces sp. Je 1-4] [Streptomyces sp. Je 1-4 4N24]UZQ46389.1 sugar kinase [Streptomyces sp. Je 1-4] [Streptomyces sp. Je 1-4 4N24_ara]